MLLLTFLIGIWRGVLSLPDQPLPFNFELQRDAKGITMIIHNADERITCNETQLIGDSLFIKLPLYDSEFHLKFQDSVIAGHWINYARKGNPEIPFSAVYGETQRFLPKSAPLGTIDGRWEVWFDAGTKDSTIAIGTFKQSGAKVTGTFLTESGDHRFLEGIVDGDSLKLSVFDGTFCKLYLARIVEDRMEGVFYSQKTYHAPFTGKRNPTITLRDPSTLSSFTGEINFTFPDLDSNLVSINDVRYKGKVVIIQIMGSWCPNCMDESEFLSDYYKKHQLEGVEMIGISFERTPDFRKAVTLLKKVKDRFAITYPLLYAGTTGKGAVEKALPGTKDFFSYPTSLYIDRAGKVVQVHTGYSGPATGVAYEKYKEEFYKLMKQLLK